MKNWFIYKLIFGGLKYKGETLRGLPRILWNSFWYVPFCLGRFVSAFCVAVANGSVSMGLEFWDSTN